MNVVILTGRLVRDPELNYISGTSLAVSQFTIAVDKTLSREKREQFESQNKPTADFIRIVVWGKQAENCKTYIGKGSKVAVHGTLNTSSYNDKTTGERKFSTDVVARTVEFLDRLEKKEGYSTSSNSSRAQEVEKMAEEFDNDFNSFDNVDDSPF